jgi:hypothetical protein
MLAGIKENKLEKAFLDAGAAAAAMELVVCVVCVCRRLRLSSAEWRGRHETNGAVAEFSHQFF